MLAAEEEKATTTTAEGAVVPRPTEPESSQQEAEADLAQQETATPALEVLAYLEETVRAGKTAAYQVVVVAAVGLKWWGLHLFPEEASQLK